MAAGSWNSPRLPSYRTWLKPCLDCVRRLTKVAPAHGAKLGQRGIILGVGFVILLGASPVWRTVVRAGVVVFIALVLQELADPSPLFWATPCELVGIVFSRNVRLNHLWFHRTQDLVREASGFLGKVDGFATQDGFVLVGAGFNEAEVGWASELAWRLMYGQGAAKESVGGCKPTRLMLAVVLVAGGLVAVTVWQGKVELASTVLVAAVSGAIGHALSAPAERFLSPWAALIAFCDGKTYRYRMEIDCFSSPRFLWFKGSQGFHVRRVELEVKPSGARQ